MKIHVKVAVEGAKMFNPETKAHVKPDGDTVEESNYWVRAKQRGDVTYEYVQPADAAAE